MGLAEIKAQAGRILSGYGLGYRSALILSVIGLLMIGLTAGGETVTLALRYDRTGIADGEYWRLISGHLVHLGWRHLWLNVFGLVLVALLFGASFSAVGWLIIMSVATFTTGLGFWLSGLDWYVGLSGLLHAVFAAGVLRLIRNRRPDGYVLALVLLGKLIWEYFAGPMPYSELSAGGPVIVAAHLYGALGGAVAAALLIVFERGRGRV